NQWKIVPPVINCNKPLKKPVSKPPFNPQRNAIRIIGSMDNVIEPPCGIWKSVSLSKINDNAPKIDTSIKNNNLIRSICETPLHYDYRDGRNNKRRKCLTS